MSQDAQMLARLSRIPGEIAACTSIDEAKDIRDRAEAIRMYAKAAGCSFEIQQAAAAAKLRAERRAGELLATMKGKGNHGGDRKSSFIVKLESLGVTKIQSHRWQRIARIPLKNFEGFVTMSVESQRDITSAAALRIAKSLENGRRNGKVKKDKSACDPVDLEDIKGKRKFTTIYADPPWQYGNQSTRAATDNHYPTMPIEEICGLPIADISEDKSLLFLWTTNGFLVEALTQVIPAWGFEYKSMIVWCKPQMGIGNYVRVSHELLLIANRGGLRPDGSRQMSWVTADRTKHSTKPHIFREIIETIAPAPRIELFARENRPGWTPWGNGISRQKFLEAFDA